METRSGGGEPGQARRRTQEKVENESTQAQEGMYDAIG